MSRMLLLLLTGLLFSSSVWANPPVEPPRVTPREPATDTELKYWLQNVTAHRYSADEIAAALSLSEDKQKAEIQRLAIDPAPRLQADRLTILPYPGGRHPRIGFLEGAIDPQRETKVSVFTPWQPADGHRADYVVVDVPEAIWSNLGLTYLAHTHIPTIWDKAGMHLARMEWTRSTDGSLKMERRLPNGITFRALVVPRQDHVAMELELHNGTTEKLTDLRVQNCVMLREAEGFNGQTADNKLMQAPYACCRHKSGDRWIITAWTPNHRTWGNPPCPCLHSDPKFPDCEPGETQRLRGWLSFFAGTNIQAELRRIEGLGWDREPLHVIRDESLPSKWAP